MQKKYFFTALIIAIITNVSAQTNKADSVKTTTDTTEKKTSYFKVSAAYLTNAAFNGRSDSGSTPYLSPTIGYYNKHGFYVSGSLSYLANSTGGVDFYSLDAGYDFDIIDNLSASISANKSFYNSNSTSIKSDVAGTISGSLSYDLFEIVSINAGADIVFASKKDYSINLGLEHEFSFGDKYNKWTVTPAVTANASSLNFYEGYTNRRVKKAAKKGNPQAVSISTVTSVSNSNVNRPTLLDYELSAPVGYGGKKWGVAFTPTLAIPQNPIHTVTTTITTLKNGTTKSKTEDSTPDTELNLKNLFYAQLSVSYKF